MTQTLTSIQRFYRYYLLLIAVVAISCKKEAGLVNLPPPDQSTSPFVKELYAQWVSYAKEHPDEASLKPNEKLDWKKIILRISSDTRRSINYYVPILNDNQPCNKALELSFGAEKNIFQAAVRTYLAPSATAGSSSEARRLQTILYNFSVMGLNIPKAAIDREKMIQEEIKQKNIASVKKQKISLAMKDRAILSVTQSSRECETTVNFDFYYIFTYNSPYSGYDVQIANYFRNEVLSYMKYGMYLDYDVPTYGGQNELTFYNISDNNQLGNMIRTALDHGAFATQSNYNLIDSYISSYYYDVLHSTCGSTGGGGGPSTGGVNAQDPGDSYEVESFNDGIDLAEKLDCFNSVPDNSNTIYTAKICADLPDNSEPLALIGPDRVGHAFITLTKTNGANSITETFGFYPQRGYKSLSTLYVDSQIEDDGATHHEYNGSYAVNIGRLDFERAISAAKTYSTLKYNINSFNCTDYALTVFNAGLSNSNQVYVPDWQPLTHNYGKTPSGLYKKIKEMKDAGKSGTSVSDGNAPSSSSCN